VAAPVGAGLILAGSCERRFFMCSLSALAIFRATAAVKEKLNEKKNEHVERVSGVPIGVFGVLGPIEQLFLTIRFHFFQFLFTAGCAGQGLVPSFLPTLLECLYPRPSTMAGPRLVHVSAQRLQKDEGQDVLIRDCVHCDSGHSIES